MDINEKRRTVFFFAIIVAVVLFSSIIFNRKSVVNQENDIPVGIDVDDGDLDIKWSIYTPVDVELDGDYEIRKNGIYRLSGDVEDGMVTVDVGDDGGVVKLILDDLKLHNNDGPAIYVKTADDIVIETAEDSVNYLSSGANYGDFGDDKVDGTIYSKGDLSFYGEGELNVESKYKHAIVSKDDLVIRSGILNVDSVWDGIRGKDSVYVAGGEINVSAKKDGVKSTNSENETKGFVYFADGTLNVDVDDDAVHATTYLIVKGGKINVAGSYEGLEGSKVIINGGDISINSMDDGINVAGGNDGSVFLKPNTPGFSEEVTHVLTVNDGNIYINASGDGLDSNGLIYVNGGKIVVDGPVDPGNSALDSENGIILNGGEVIAIGSSEMVENPSDLSLSRSFNIYLDNSQPKSTKISIRSETGDEIFSHVSGKSFSNIIVSSDSIVEGNKYSLYLNDKKNCEFSSESLNSIVGEKAGLQGEKGGFPGPQNNVEIPPNKPDEDGENELNIKENGGDVPPNMPDDAGKNLKNNQNAPGGDGSNSKTEDVQRRK